MVNHLQTYIQKVDKIFHLSDIHIRNFIRHKEYSEVFERTVEEIRKRKTPNSINYVAGDIVHSKSDMSPELVYMVFKFFSMLAEECPTLVIVGNHDTNLNNPNRLDTLKPIIELMSNDRLYFLEKNGYYTFAQLGLNLMEVSTLPLNFLPGSGLDTEIKIALHHGAVNFAVTDLQTQIKNKEVTIETFDGHDLALLGDIHKRQFLQTRKVVYDDVTGETVLKPTIAYPSSLIQQGHGESLDSHGFLVWNMSDFSYEEVDIRNDYGYFTLLVEEGKILNWSDNIPKKPRLRVYFKDTSIEDEKIIEAYIRSKVSVVEWATHKVKSQTLDKTNHHQVVGNIRDVEYQNTLLEQFLMDTYPGISEELLDQIRYINRTINSKLPQHSKTGVLRNVQWIPDRFEFSNMFSYGENNVIDFNQISGIYGIFGHNAAGKSTIFDALCFCLFDKCSKTYKARDVINRSKDWFTCKFTFHINNVKYIIEKKAARTRTENVKVDINFSYENEAGDLISLNGEQRDATSKVIRDYVGTYEDFILTVLSVQNNGTNFIEKPQRERRELIVNFLDISIFEQLHSIASEELNSSDIKWKMKAFESQDFAQKLSQAIKDRQESKDKVEELKEKYQDLELQLENLQDKKSKLVQDLKSIEPVEDVSILEIRLNSTIKEITEAENSINALNCDHFSDAISKLEAQDLEIHIKDLEAKLKQLQHYQKEEIQLKSEIKSILAFRDQYEKHILNLTNHKYDPNCTFCTAHPTVQAGIEAEQEREKCEERLSELQANLEDLKLVMQSFSGVEAELKVYKEQLSQKSKLLSAQLDCTSKKHNYLNKINTLQATKQSLDSQLQKSRLLQEYKIHNNKTQQEINQIDQSVTVIRTDLQDINKKITHHTGIVYSKETLIKECQEQLKEVQNLKLQYDAYTQYLQAVKTDGIPYRLTNEIIPLIEEEVNHILKGVTDFKLILETDNKNINAYIAYNDEVSWPVESGSGMEKFMTSLALRTALIVNTSLPKPNFMCIDEGFGVLDSENLTNISILFEKIKVNFNTVFCISHLDSMRDITDGTLLIDKISGHSHVSIE